jgi:RNA polymerase sigma-70 factor (ECF subfamily)
MPLKSEPSNQQFNRLYTTYKNKVYNLAYRMTGNQQAAEDIVQETFVQVWKHFGQFKGESQVFTWIYSIAKNICYRHYSKQKRSSFKTLETLLNNAGAEDSGRLLETLAKQNYILQVKEGCLLGLLRCLSFHQRMVFILNVLFDVPVVSVGKIIGKSANSTRILIHRARAGITRFLCKNCSLYDTANPCRCQNLVDFSLKQGWIHPEMPEITRQVEAELAELKREIGLYKTLPDRTLSPDFNKKMTTILKQKELLIFSGKKVK